MNRKLIEYALTLLLITSVVALQGCQSLQPVAVECPSLPPVSAWMMEPARNADLIQPLYKTLPTTPTN